MSCVLSRAVDISFDFCIRNGSHWLPCCVRVGVFNSGYFVDLIGKTKIKLGQLFE